MGKIKEYFPTLHSWLLSLYGLLLWLISPIVDNSAVKWWAGNGMTKTRKLAWLGARAVMICLVITAYVVLATKIHFDWGEWSLYANAKGPKSLFNCGFLTTIIFAWELGTDGPTIKSILHINENSDWKEKAVAAGFLLGILALYAYCIAGGT